MRELSSSVSCKLLLGLSLSIVVTTAATAAERAWQRPSERLAARLATLHQEAATAENIDAAALAFDWRAEGNVAFAQFGISVDTAGDVNGDGYDDVIVGAFNDDGKGRVFVYHGSASGLSKTANWTVGSDRYSLFGGSVARAGDVNGDGYSDVIVGAPSFSNDQAFEGKVFVYYGSPSGLSLNPDWTAEGDQDSADFGFSVASAGDVNDDGYSDLIVGAPSYSAAQERAGKVFVYYGSPSGPSASPDWTVESDQSRAVFGISVGSAGDVNGDGFSDIIVGADSYDDGQTDEGRAFLYLGSVSGLSLSAAWTAESNQDAAYFGNSVATAGDVNGDGYSDVIIGADNFTHDQLFEGGAFVYLGSANGLALTPAWSADSDQDYGSFGSAVASAGDVNGDGYSDVIVGATFYESDNNQRNEGKAYVFLGSASGLALTPTWTAESNRKNSALGSSVAGAGDVNADGFDDFIIGVSGLTHGQPHEGGAVGVLGSPDFN